MNKDDVNNQLESFIKNQFDILDNYENETTTDFYNTRLFSKIEINKQAKISYSLINLSFLILIILINIYTIYYDYKKSTLNDTNIELALFDSNAIDEDF